MSVSKILETINFVKKSFIEYGKINGNADKPSC